MPSISKTRPPLAIWRALENIGWMLSNARSSALPAKPPAPPAFSEAPAWNAVREGWRPLFGNFRQLGFSFEWHDFWCDAELAWGRSFHPGSVELCLNLEGSGMVSDGRQTIELSDRTLAFYHQGHPPLAALRRPRQQHRFITVEYAPGFLAAHFRDHAENLHPLVEAVACQDTRASQVTPPEPIASSLLQLIEGLRHCPVFKPAQEIWFRCKALELASQLFFRPAAGELFCTRAQRVAQERIARAQAILKKQMQDPPSLKELGRVVGCSPFHLSRQFSEETGLTMLQYVRQVRLERAADLLRSGQCNVTEAAFEVGYNSLSHFTVAFRETYGCCPGLYPLKTPTQRLS